MKKFNNKDRTRYYGIRIGDEVEERFQGRVTISGIVVEYGFMDNNAVHVKSKSGNIQKCVAEWCTIVKRVDDKERATS